jgi:hypothetical protein
MSAEHKDFEEKRNFIRMFVDAKVIITDPETGQTFTGESKNLSGNGVLFTCEQTFAVGKTLHLSISSEESQLRPLNAELEVIRVDPLADNRYEIAGTISSVE